MIVLEGPDGAGKTTLLKVLTKAFPSIETHEKASTSTGGPVANIAQWAYNDLLSWGLQPLSFYDRHPMISEPFYGPLLRNKLDPWFGSQDALKIASSVMFSRGLIVYCLPPLEKVIENLAAEEQLEGVEGNIMALYGLYQRQLMRFSKLHPKGLFHYDYTRGPAELDHLCEIIEAHEIRWNRTHNQGRIA